MNTYTFTIRAKGKSWKSATRMFFRADNVVEARAMFDAARPEGSYLLSVSEA